MPMKKLNVTINQIWKLIASLCVCLLLVDVSLAAGTSSKKNGKDKDKPAHGKPGKKPKKNPPPKDKKPKKASIKYSGQATLVYLTNGLSEPHTILLGDTGPLPASGGTIEVIVGATNISSLDVGMGRAFTTGAGNEARSEVSIQNFSFMFHTTNNDIHTVAFSVLTAEARATCDSNGVASVTATVNLQGLTFDGVAVQVTGEANQVVSFPGGALIINFQQSSTTGGSGDIVAAGLVIALDGCLHGGIGVVHADIHCRRGGPGDVPPSPVECDRITGGGFILLNEVGDKATFAVTGGIRRGTPVGHLNYIDHTTGLHISSHDVVSYSAVDADVRQIVYNISIDGQAATATVLVADLGEPGVNDLFDLTLSTGYHVGGDLGGSGSGGGNLQLHKCPRGWTRGQ